MHWTGVKEGDRIQDPDCEMNGLRWNGDLLGKGLGLGTVLRVYHGGVFTVQHNHYKMPVMYGANGIRFDRMGKKGSHRVWYIQELHDYGLWGEVSTNDNTL